MILWNIIDNSGRLLENTYDPPNGAYFSETVKWVFVGLLSGLQALLVIWAVSIAKVLYRVISGSGAKDDRSDSSDAEE